VNDCMDLYRALTLKTPNVLDLLLSREQVGFESMPKTVCAAHWTPDKIIGSSGQQLRTPDRQRRTCALLSLL